MRAGGRLARIADACLGGLTAYLAHHEGQPWQHAARYADRHHERAVPPLTAISLGNLGRSLRVGQVGQIGPAIARIRALGQYVQSGQDADDPGIRTARIRSELEYLLNLPGLDIPRDSLGPFLDFLAEKIVARPRPRLARAARPARLVNQGRLPERAGPGDGPADTLYCLLLQIAGNGQLT